MINKRLQKKISKRLSRYNSKAFEKCLKEIIIYYQKNDLDYETELSDIRYTYWANKFGFDLEKVKQQIKEGRLPKELN